MIFCEGRKITMKKLRRAHLWIGLFASIFIFMEAMTGLLMNEPWLIGQSTIESGRGNFQPGQFNQGQNPQGRMGGSGQANGQTQGQSSGQTQGQANNGQTQGQTGFSPNGQFQGRQAFGANGNSGMRGSQSQGIVGTIRSLHQGVIGNTNVKWLIDLIALAMMFLTGTGVYLSIKVLSAESKRKKRQEENLEVLPN
jgi:hypothetical protein